MSFKDIIIQIAQKGYKFYKDSEKEYCQMNCKFNQMDNKKLMSYSNHGKPQERAMAGRVLAQRGIKPPTPPKQ